tara:strand:+ start:557 stop:757 length:201 start_codon:yes stop_codon:yes gene_type:complete
MYLIINANALAQHIENSTSSTPAEVRHSVDGTKAVLKMKMPTAETISHKEVVEILATADWEQKHDL